MAIPQFAKIQSNDQVQNRTQDSLAKVLNPVLKNPLLNGNIIGGLTLASGVPLAVDHKLARQPVGWALVDLVGAAIVSRTDWNKQQITLLASANCSISILVF